MRFLGWALLGTAIFLADSAIHNESPVTRLKLVLGQGSVTPTGNTAVDPSKPVMAATPSTGPTQ